MAKQLNVKLYFTIPEDIRNITQRANIERDACRDIIVYIMSNKVDIPKERFDEYQKDYDEKFMAFEQAKSIIHDKYVRPFLDSQGVAANSNYSWNLDYNTCEIEVTVENE